MASKYIALKGKLPAFELEPEFQSKINSAKAIYSRLTPAELANELALQRKNKNYHEEQIKNTNVELEALSQLIVEHLEADDLQKIQLASGITVYTQVEPYSSLTSNEELMAYLKKAKLTNLLTLHYQTMNALNKERLINGKPVLPGTRCFLKTSARLRGASAGGDE